jgi:hypothetical protein
MKKYNKNILTEVNRINELMGLNLISEGVLEDVVRVILNNVKSYTDVASTTARQNLENALRIATTQNTPIDFNRIADDLWKLAGNNPDLSSKIIEELFRRTPALRTYVAIKSAMPSWRNVKSLDEVEGIVDNMVRSDFASQPNLTPGVLNFIKKEVVDKVTASLTTFLSKEQKELLENLVESNESVWDKIFINGNAVAAQVLKDLEVLTTVKFVDPADPVYIQKRVQDNLKKLADWRTSTYNELMNQINAIAKGQTTAASPYRYDSLVKSIKDEFGDWGLMNEISKTKPWWQKVMITIGDGFYNGVKAEFNFVRNLLSIPIEFLSNWKYTTRFFKSVGDASATQASKATQTNAFRNWLLVYSPRGLPIDANIKNYQDIYNTAGKWGMHGSYWIEVATRAYKFAAYIVVAKNVWEFLTAGTNKIDADPNKRKCNDNLIKIIKQSNLGPDQVEEFIISQFDPNLKPAPGQPVLPCIRNIKWTEKDLTEFVSVAIYRAKGGKAEQWLERVAKESYNRIIDDWRLGGPPIISIPSLFEQFGQEKSIYAVISENMPEIDMTRVNDLIKKDSIKKQGPVIRQNVVPQDTTQNTPVDTALVTVPIPGKTTRTGR